MSQSNEKPFGPYRLIKRLAMGGMAELYQAHRVGVAGFVRDVVIKRIHPEYSDDDEFVRMFINEAKIAAMLRHPNIVPVLDFDYLEGMYYLVMELVDGLDLRQLSLRALREKQPLPVPLAVFIVAQALQGLAYAHHFSQRGQVLNVVHRDISPQNILLSVRGHVMITDFGIARVQQHASMTAHGVLKGKASYMAPEQTLSSQVDARADLFSMGVVLWELLCGERLFVAPNDVLVMEKVRSHPIPPPHTRNAAVDESLSALVMWALERDPARRIPDAHAWLKILQPWLSSPHLRDELAAYVCLLCHNPIPSGGVGVPVLSEPSPQPHVSVLQTLELEPRSLPHNPTLSAPPISPAQSPEQSPEHKTERPDETPRSWSSFPMWNAVESQTPGEGQPHALTSPPPTIPDTQDALLQTVRIEPHVLLSAAKEEVRLSQTTGAFAGQPQPTEPADVLATVLINPKEYLQQMQSQVSSRAQSEPSENDESAQHPQLTERMDLPKDPNKPQ